MKLRPYQAETVASVEAAWRRGVQRPAAVLATGLGKTVIFTELIRKRYESGQRSLILVHREELADQAIQKIRGAIGVMADIGLVKAGRNDVGAAIVVASVPTIVNRLDQFPAGTFGLGVADECHHAASDSWKKVIDHFTGAEWVGFTATMSRGDKKKLGDVWDEIVTERDIEWGIRHKYLAPVVGKRVALKNLMLDEVKRSRGDLSADDLGDALDHADAGDAIARAYGELGGNRPAVMFLPTVATAERFAAIMSDAGHPCEVITGATSSVDRHAIFDRFRTGVTRVLSNCMVLTEGWDAPWAEVAIMARPTKSRALYAQCVGRVLRPFPAGGKTSALVIDVVGAGDRLGLASLTELTGSNSAYPDQAGGGVAGERKPGPAIPEIVRETSDGDMIVSDMALFDGAVSCWLQTDSGVWFIPTKNAYFYVGEGASGWGVARKPVGGPPGHGEVLVRGFDLEGAMRAADEMAATEDPSISGAGSAWRGKQPSPKMTDFARRLGIDPTGKRQGVLSSEISVVLASRAIPTPA